MKRNPSRRSRSTCGRSWSAGGATSFVAGRVATSSTRPTANSAGHRERAQRGERHADQDARDRGADRALEHRPHDAFDAVGGQQLFGGQDPRQQRAVGGEEERRRDARARRRRRPCARCAVHQANSGRRPSTPTATLTVSTAMMMVRWLIRSAAMPPTRTNATRPAPRQVATSDSDAGSSSSAMTCSAITTAHMPSAKIEMDSAPISRRYSRNRNGASTRQPPVTCTGCSTSNCVLTT